MQEWKNGDIAFILPLIISHFIRVFSILVFTIPSIVSQLLPKVLH